MIILRESISKRYFQIENLSREMHGSIRQVEHCDGLDLSHKSLD